MPTKWRQIIYRSMLIVDMVIRLFVVIMTSIVNQSRYIVVKCCIQVHGKDDWRSRVVYEN